MKFGKFLEYVRLYDSGKLWEDHAYKNYDLLHTSGMYRLRRALRECGFDADEISVALAECHTRVRERGFAAISQTVLSILLMEWFVWWRVNEGVYKKWKYRNKTCRGSSAPPQPTAQGSTEPESKCSS